MKAQEKVPCPPPRARQPILEKQRRLKMAHSAHAYVRGNTFRFYEWLEAARPGTMPEGPTLWICGDCHLGNLGPISDTEGRVAIQVRDLDQTVPGNPAHDLIRLGLSLATAARGSDLPGVTTAQMIEHMVDGYCHALSAGDRRHPKPGRDAESVQALMTMALKRRWRHLAEERIEDVSPRIPLGKRFWSLSKTERGAIDELLSSDEGHALVTALQKRDDNSKIEVLDAAYWMKGCSSLGRLRYAVLLGIGRKHHRSSSFCLVDIKEAVGAAAPHAKGIRLPKDHAVRVVEGARHLSPFLGERMLAARFLRRPVVLRELMPQDLKLEMDRLNRNEAVACASYLAGVIGASHGRQLDRSTRSKWRKELERNRTKSLDAPSWLWKCVVELVASHETAYLEHCRRYAMER